MAKVDMKVDASREELRRFGRALLDDIHTLDVMCRNGEIESGARRIGAELEMFLVDEQGHPAPLAPEVLARLADGAFTPELGRFNLEYNVPVQLMSGDFLSRLHTDLSAAVERVSAYAAKVGTHVLLTGILPSLEEPHLALSNLSPEDRYAELNRVMTRLAGGRFPVHITGADNLELVHDNVMLEACNASFQIHFQAAAPEFPALYNLAQLITAPLLAASANSPVLLGHRLWRETRIALFQQSVDVRSESERRRSSRQRVWFGDSWVRESVTEIFRDDVSRFPALLTMEMEEPSSAVRARGEVPELHALRLYNGTVYRWNRPCYGITAGKPHLRIEHRVLPSGPTVQDMVANAAFYFGLMSELSVTSAELPARMSFDHVRSNFIAAARYGLNTTLRWIDGRTVPAQALILDELLPKAESGLQRQGVPQTDIDEYLGILAARVESGRTGAEWQLQALEKLSAVRARNSRYELLTRIMMERQHGGSPVHQWEAPAPRENRDWRDAFQTVAQVMTTDLFTVSPEHSAELAAGIMYWRNVRHVPVEDSDGRLVGVLSYRSLLRILADGAAASSEPASVAQVMSADPLTATPDMSCLAALRLMHERGVACLPVVDSGRLVGIISERDFAHAAGRLLEESLAAHVHTHPDGRER